MARSTKSSWLEGPGDLKQEEVEDVPIEGESVLVRGLPAAYSNQASSEALEMKQLAGGDQIATVNTDRLEVLQFAHGVITDDGQQMFDEAEAEAISKKYGPAFKRVVGVIDRLSGVDKEALENARARFPSGGGSENGVHVEDGPAAGRPGPDVSPRAVPGVGDVEG